MRQASKSTGDTADNWLLGAVQLMLLANSIKSANILQLSHVGMLVLGKLRQCSESRAEAIMSVICATNWFTSASAQTNRVPRENNLALGVYPLVFVQEVAEQVGEVFYCTLKSTPVSSSYWTAPFAQQAVESMLPFAAAGNCASVTAMEGEPT